MNRSPLGKYSQVIAAVTALLLIGSYVLALIFQEALHVSQGSVDRLQLFAGVAVGAVFGAAATVNGVKEPIESAHTRIDRIESATGIPTHGEPPTSPAPPSR
jgi:hypothetical protein